MALSRIFSNHLGVFSSLRAKMLMLVFIALIPALGLLLYSANVERAEHLAETKDKIAITARATANNLEKIAEGSKYLLTALAHYPAIKNLDSVASSAVFADALETLPLHGNILALKLNGDIFASAVPSTTPLNAAHLPYFQNIINGDTFSFGDYQVGRILKRPVIISSYPVLGKNGQLVAVVAYSLDLEKLNSDLAKELIPAEGVLTIVDNNGTILAQNPDPEKKWQGKVFPEEAIIKTSLSHATEIQEMDGLDGVRRIYSFSTVAAGGDKLHVIFGISMKNAMASVDRNYYISLLLFAIISAISIFSAFYIATLAKNAQEKLKSSEYAFMKLSANVPGMIYQFTRRPNGTYFVPIASAGIKDLFGCTPEDVVDDFSPIATVILPEDRSRVIDEIEYSAKHLESFMSEYRVRIPFKPIQWLLSESHPEKLADGSVTWYGFNADITERKKSELEAYEIKNRNEAILRSIGDSVFATDKDGTIILFNKTAEETIGIPAEKAIGSHYSQIVTFIKESDGTPANDFVSEAIREGKIKELANHILLIKKNGTTIPVADSAAPIMSDDGTVIGCVVVFRDITKEYQIDKAKTEFVSLASHQLRTPPTAISWFTELLLKGDFGTLNEKQKEYVSEIRHSNLRMIDLINALLSTSRIELGTFSVTSELMNVATIADDVLDELRIKIKEKELKVGKKYTSDISSIECDPKLVRIILQNLLTNAISYTPAHGEISLDIREVDKGIRLEVHDSGCGIPQDSYPKIFTRFFRADNARNVHPDGNGLGLYITKSLTEALGGTITFTSKVNNGTIFSVILPDVHTLKNPQ